MFFLQSYWWSLGCFAWACYEIICTKPNWSGLWGIGLIPTFIGIGLLMFVRLSRGMNHIAGSDQEPA
jgi:hypothetical protein